MSHASSPICPFRTFPFLKSLGNQATACTSLGFSFATGASLVAFVALVREGLFEQLYKPLTIERDKIRIIFV